ncbi:RraA family protein [Aneurinibacillus sp. Ricciae_BoGa-3]|uniref:RraA family protein n=1 Tax=Aneurinibacillus sp. Ricciae_BoGa-3 TaxID=3022697 RepID=UPI0023405066|nr:RraA family protein [Aneurinibacillus sp. Ricciae_BoGa-3]WCK56414.1 RraA family protein [Aneurinibacillus sp. Ricciae_BoGa-3]
MVRVQENKHQLALIERLSQFDSAIVSDCLMDNSFAMDNGIKPLASNHKICGPALTVQCPPRDNLMLHLAVSKAQPRDVIVASMSNHYEGGAWGEILTVAAKQQQVAGLVVDGSVRDTQQIIDMQFPLFTRGISIKKTDKKNAGKLGVPVIVGGVTVNPGDIILGDADGVVVIPGNRLEDIVIKAEEKVNAEKEIIAQLHDGHLTVDLFDLRKYDI